MATAPVKSKLSVGAETRARLIASAVRHFARDGFGAASQRAIQRDAGVNAASAHYHFGSKEALYRAVIETFIHDIQAERVRRHAAVPLELKGQARLERLLFDYFYPGIAIAATEHGRPYALILARVQGEVRTETAAAAIFADAVREVRGMYMRDLETLFPKTEPRSINEWLAAAVTLMATTPLRYDVDGMTADVYAAKYAGELSKFVAAGMAALFGPAA
jgi:AcrR family transcriptional regulator